MSNEETLIKLLEAQDMIIKLQKDISELKEENHKLQDRINELQNTIYSDESKSSLERYVNPSMIPGRRVVIYQNKEYLCAKGVYKIIYDYINNHKLKGIYFTYNDFKKIFTDELQGSFGVFTSRNDFEKKNLSEEEFERRYYSKYPIELNDELIYICNQYSYKNINNFIERAKELGIDCSVQLKK